MMRTNRAADFTNSTSRQEERGVSVNCKKAKGDHAPLRRAQPALIPRFLRRRALADTRILRVDVTMATEAACSRTRPPRGSGRRFGVV